MHTDIDVFDDELLNKVVPTKSPPLVAALQKIGNPLKALGKVRDLVDALVAEVERKWSPEQRNEMQLCQGELLSSVLERWRKLQRDFWRKDSYDTRKLPDIYDCIKYDFLHNQQELNLETAPALYETIAPLASLINPQEYGLTAIEKLTLAKQVVQPLMKKILMDLQLAARDLGASVETAHRLDTRYAEGIDSPAFHVRSRLYFTSESHILTLLNILRYANLNPENPDANTGVIAPDAETYLDRTSEFNYLTHIVFRLFERVGRDKADQGRFRVEVLLSPGVSTRLSDIDVTAHKSQVHPILPLNTNLTLSELEEIMANVCS
jgi:inositol hexakisphosphate/diphosphoinositol-pentakisphosphate kinase